MVLPLIESAVSTEVLMPNAVPEATLVTPPFKLAEGTKLEGDTSTLALNLYASSVQCGPSFFRRSISSRSASAFLLAAAFSFAKFSSLLIF